jgi:predicted transcriptional regulator
VSHKSKSTSVKTYQELKNSGELSKQQKKVLQAFINVDYVATRNEVKNEQLPEWEKSTISGRVNELLSKGFLQETGKRVDLFSGRKAETLMVTQPGEPEDKSEDLKPGDVIFEA